MQNGFEFYFGEANPDETYELDGLFQEDGKYYYFKMVVEDDMFAIHDTCNRMMPFDRTQTNAMNLAMFGVSRFYSAIADADKLFESRMHETQQLMQFWKDE